MPGETTRGRAEKSDVTGRGKPYIRRGRQTTQTDWRRYRTGQDVYSGSYSERERGDSRERLRPDSGRTRGSEDRHRAGDIRV